MNNNYDLIQYFLNMMKEFAISNPNKQITEDFVYSILIRFNINNNQCPNQNVKDKYEIWKKRYENNNNIKVFEVQRKSFLWFSNGNLTGNEIKLYIPLDYNHLVEGANQLFDFIASTNMVHQSKIASIIRNDNVVVRVTNLEDAKKVIDFVNNNNYIKEGMIKVNPFLPNCNGVGITMDNKFSFNSETSKLISNFVEYMKKINRLDLITLDNFNNYIKNNIPTIQDPDLKDIYSLLSKTTTRTFKLNDFIEHANNKLIDKYTTDKKVRIIDPKYYLERCIALTEKKHPGNSKVGLLEYLKSNPMYFTNDERVREGLIKYVKPNELIPIMRTKLQENNIPIPQTDKELIETYLNKFFRKNYSDEFEIIKTAYINTLNKYNPSQADFAFRQLYLNKNISCFTNDFNDRNRLKELLSLDIKKVILSNIDLNNLENVNNVSEILFRFKNTINDTKQKISNI